MRYIILIIITTVLYGCQAKEKTQVVQPVVEDDVVSLTEEQVQNAGIETAVIEKRQLKGELQVNGQVDVPPQNIVSVSFAMGGYLKHTKLMPGMHVSKGEVIATMEDPALVELQQEYLVAVSRMQFLEQDFKRQQLLNQNKVNADKVLQRAESEYNSQKVLVRGYAEKLRLIGINPGRLSEGSISRTVPVYSPISGFVSRVNVNIGKYVNPADVLFELINPDDLHAALTIFEKDISNVKTGQPVMVSFISEPGVEYPCRVILVTRNVDDDRTALVHCHFDQKPKQLLPGMFLNARIAVSDSLALAVPDAAVVRYGSAEYILAVEGKNTYRLIEVKTGRRNGAWVELNPGDSDLQGREIIVRNPYPVLSALKNTADE